MKSPFPYSHEERCAQSVECNSKQKSGEGGGVKLSYVRELAYLANIMEYQVAHMNATSMYIQRQAGDLIRELRVQEISENGDEELFVEFSTKPVWKG